MRKTLALFVLAASTLTLQAQQKKSDGFPTSATVTDACIGDTCIAALKQQVTELQDQLAERDITVANLKMALLQNQATGVSQERNSAFKQLETRHPGMHWDDAVQRLVPNAPPAKPEPAKK